MTTAYITHPDYLLPDKPNHPEHAGRLRHITQVLEAHQMDNHLLALDPLTASPETASNGA